MMNAPIQPTLREPFLDIKSFASMLSFRVEKAIPDLVHALATEDIDAEDLGYVKRQVFDHRWAAALLLYSGGQPLSEVANALRRAISASNDYLEDGNAPFEFVDLATQTYYVEALWLLSLTKLLGLGDEQVERVANFYAADETNDGADELFELVLAKLGRKSFEAEGLIHEDPYQLLLDCVKAEPDQRPELMTKFLKRWFKGQRECDWWGSHINRRGTPVLDTGFFGYWAFEAALVTYLWDIDDSSYRDLPHYPKDLIDHAREHYPLGSEPNPIRLRVEAGLPCPREGFWVAVVKTDSRRHFKQGEVMPDLRSAAGVTIWQWDSKQ